MGKARSFSNEANEIVFQTESNNENFAMGSQNSYNLGSVHFSDQSGIGNFSQSGQNSKFAQVKGSLFQGNIGFVQQTVELDVGTSTINLNNDSTGAALAVISQDRIVTLSAGSTSDLTTITGAQRQGQRVTLYNIFSNTITIKNNAGATVNTIVTPGAVDFTLSGHALVTLVFDISLAQWRIEGNIGGGSGSQTPWTSDIDGAGFTLTNAGNIIIKNIQTDGTEAILTLERNDTTPTDGDTIGSILYDGPAVDDGVVATWAGIVVEAIVVDEDAKQAELTISVQHDNSLAPIINYTGDDATFRFSSGVDVVRPNANGSKEFGNASFFWDDVFTETLTLRGSGGNTTGTARTVYADAAGMIFNMPLTAAAFTHSIENEIFSLLTNGELELRTELNNGFTLRLRSNDQTPTNNDEVASILFTGEDDNLDEQTYGSISVFMSDVGASTKQAAVSFRGQQNNSLKIWMNFLGASDKINMFSDVDMNFDDIIDMGGGTINLITTESVVDQSNDFLMFFDASVNALRKINFASLPPGGGSFLPLDGTGIMLGDIDLGGNNLDNVDDIIFDVADTSIEVGGGIVTHDYASGDTWRIREGATSRIIIDTGFRITSSTNIGVFGSTAVAKQTVTGSRAGNAALASLLTALANYGWVTDNTT